MRALPPLTLTLSRYPIWNAAVCALGALSLTCATAWAWTWRDALGFSPLPVLAAMALSIAWLVLGLWRRGETNLSWDGARWQLGPRPDPVTCDCTAVLDLGGWMLLRCRTPGSAWIPVQRGLTGCDWHALRCTVYSPRPAPVRSDGPARPSKPE